MQPTVSPARVAIVLSMFNGERYLLEQLRSIAQQTFAGWRLFLRDDGSTDATREKAENFAKEYPDQVVLMDERAANIGVVSSFSRLVQQADADYVLFSDQDDIWLPDKVSKTLAAMRAGEKRYGVDTPLLVHTDLRVVDRSLRPLAPSFWKYRQLAPQSGARLHRLLVQNVVTGCTVMINRPLAALAMPIPETAAMHDWWLALVATLFGRILHVDEATVLYRQHEENCVGASQWGLQRMWRQARHPQAVQAGILRSMRQARALLDRYHDRMQPEQVALVEAYAALPCRSKNDRFKTMMACRFFKHGLIRTAGFMGNVLALGERGV